MQQGVDEDEGRNVSERALGETKNQHTHAFFLSVAKPSLLRDGWWRGCPVGDSLSCSDARGDRIENVG